MAFSECFEICEAARLQPRNMTPTDVYLTSGKILNDSVIRERALAMLKGSSIPRGTTIKIVKAMTPAERSDLRERVAAVIKFLGAGR